MIRRRTSAHPLHFFLYSGGNSSLVVQSGSIAALWNTVAGGSSSIAYEAVSGLGTYYTGQSPDNVFDGKSNSIYSSRGSPGSGNVSTAGLNTGFHFTIAQCQPTLVQFRIATTTGGADRDPMTMTIEGTNCANLTSCSSWTLLYNGTTGLASITARQTFGPLQTITNPQSFTGYRFLMTSKRNNGNSIFVSYSEVELYGY